jgi:hypothetical protein
MKKFVLTVAVVALFASPSFAQTGAMGLFADNQGLSCNITVPAAGPLSVYVVHKSPGGATGAQWTLNAPTSATFFYTGGAVANPNILSIGDQTDLSLAYGGCISGDFHTYTLNFFSTAVMPSCSYMSLVPAPNKPGVISVDCIFAEIPVIPGKGILNADGTCDCNVATEESTWGKVKALYR